MHLRDLFPEIICCKFQELRLDKLMNKIVLILQANSFDPKLTMKHKKNKKANKNLMFTNFSLLFATRKFFISKENTLKSYQPIINIMIYE